MQDVTAYRDVVRELKSPKIDYLFDILLKLMNLMLIKPQNVRQVWQDYEQSGIPKELMANFIQLRVDYKLRLQNVVKRYLERWDVHVLQATTPTPTHFLRCNLFFQLTNPSLPFQWFIKDCWIFPQFRFGVANRNKDYNNVTVLPNYKSTWNINKIKVAKSKMWENLVNRFALFVKFAYFVSISLIEQWFGGQFGFIYNSGLPRDIRFQFTGINVIRYDNFNPHFGYLMFFAIY